MNKIVTLGIFAHVDAGKTTLTENILYKYNIINKLGRVDSGDTITDSLSVEKRRGITIRTSYVSFSHQEKTVQLLDTPGHVDFFSEVIRAVNVLDVAILVVSGVEGIESQTKVIWDMLLKKKTPTFIFINKLDRIGASYYETLDKIKLLLSEKAVSFVDVQSGDSLQINYRDKKILFEDCIMNDLDMLTSYLNDDFSNVEMDSFISRLIKNSAIYPVFGGSTLHSIGIDLFLDKLLKYMPYINLEVGDLNDSMFSAYTYTVRSISNSKEAIIKVLRGSLKNRDVVLIDDQENKITSIEKMIGNTRVSCDALYAGELGIVKGIDVSAGQIIGEETTEAGLFKITPILSVSLVPQGIDIQTFHNALQDLNNEDSNLNLRYNADSRQFQVDVLGELQAETIVELLQERYNIACVISEPKIIYKETPRREGRGISSYTSVSLVELRVIPEKGGFGIQFASSVTASELPDKYQKQIRRLVFEYLNCGVYGWSVTDITVELIGGKWDSVGSQSSHFNIATPVALARALRGAGSKILEPTVEYRIRFDRDDLNLVMDEISSTQYRYESCKPIKNDTMELSGRAFISEFTHLSVKLRKVLKGGLTVDYFLNGFSYNKNNETIRNDFPSINAFDINMFSRITGVSIKPLDSGLWKVRGKPKKIKRNSRLWEKR